MPAQAELNFLDRVKWLEMYGVDLHPVLGEDHIEYYIGLTPGGIVVLKNKTKVGNYFWPRIGKMYYKGCFFMLQVKDKNVSGTGVYMRTFLPFRGPAEIFTWFGTVGNPSGRRSCVQTSSAPNCRAVRCPPEKAKVAAGERPTVWIFCVGFPPASRIQLRALLTRTPGPETGCTFNSCQINSQAGLDNGIGPGRS